MKQEKPLTDLYQRYIDRELSKTELEGKIFQYLLGNHEMARIFGGNRDYWNEFISWLYPRLGPAIERYRERGASFDAYIAGLINCASKEYRRREAAHYLTEYACWEARTEEMMVYETELGYSEQAKDFFIPKGMKPRQILILLLKSYYYVTDDLISRAAAATGMSIEVLWDMIVEIERKCSKHEAERLALRERLYCQHYRCLAYEKRMNAAEPGTEYHKRLKDRFERAKTRFCSMKKRLEKMRVNASNRIISEVTGIPKGTVDSTLSSIKNRFKSGSDAA